MATERKIPLDPAYAAHFERVRNNPRPSGGNITAKEYRDNVDKIAATTISLPKIIEEERIITYNNNTVNLFLLRPLGTENEVLPVILYFHGGGFVFGSKYSHSKGIREICIGAHAAAIFVDYSLAPEAKYPTAHSQCFSALNWLLEHGSDINVDTSRIAVCGDSAGGNLASAIALMAKEKFPNNIKSQVLIYPWVSPTYDSFDSYTEFGKGDYPLSLKDIEYYDRVYFATEPKTSHSHPLLATDKELQGLPPAIVLTAEADVLRDEGEAYARRLAAAGVPTTAVRLLGASKFAYIYHAMLFSNSEVYKSTDIFRHLLKHQYINSR
ncbi:alpha/beta hydrolase fold-domain-containing protein [Fennellomyces sp. T-0311]|nr:alpha/beta hydrolase fold-domain-containing protein [Fennellomyces sp. T-0311]